jgi:hypothetical protein
MLRNNRTSVTSQRYSTSTSTSVSTLSVDDDDSLDDLVKMNVAPPVGADTTDGIGFAPVMYKNTTTTASTTALWNPEDDQTSKDETEDDLCK